MPMTTTRRVFVTAALAGVFGGALYLALQSQPGPSSLALPGLGPMEAATPLQGLIALDVEPFFKDSRVQARLAEKRLPVVVSRVGSRDMAGKLGAGPVPDFLFPSGVVAGNQVADAARKAGLPVAQLSPFFTPMVIASWEPVAKILVANGLAQPMAPKVYSVDMAQLTQLMLARTRWKDLKASAAYPVSRSVLVSTTDLRRSNSGALYLALTSHALTGDVVTDRSAARQAASRLTELFKRQGYQENYVNGNFDDYVSIGMGKAPMAFIYENQLVQYALSKQGVGPDMVLLYPQPTIVNKVVFVSLNDRAKALGELLSTDSVLQGIGVEHGFRIADSAKFMAAVQPTGLAVQARLTQVVDPPSYEIMAEMLETVAQEMSQ